MSLQHRRSDHHSLSALRLSSLDGVRLDLRYAIRHLRRAPGFTAGVALTLAFGIGANATMAGAIDWLLLRPPAHVRDARTLSRLLFSAGDGAKPAELNEQSNYPAFADLRDHVPAFEDVAAYSSAQLSFGEGSTALDVRAVLATGAFFRVFGVKPVAGRFFTPEDDSLPTASPAAVVSEAFWQRDLGGDAGVVGRGVRIGRGRYTIVGIAPREFRGVARSPVDVWIPMSAAAGEQGMGSQWASNRGSFWLSMVARLRSGVSPGVAGRQATALLRRRSAEIADPDTAITVVAASVIPGRGPDRPREVRLSLWLAGLSTFVLLIACVNVVNLLLGRAFARRREVAIRLALGVSRGRLSRQLLLEAMLLAACGGAAALVVVCAGTRVLRHYLFGTAPSGAGLIDVRNFAITGAVTGVTAILIGVVPLTQAWAPSVLGGLRPSSAGVARGTHTRAAFVAVQAMLSIILLIGAGLFARSLHRVESLDLGVDLDRTVVASVDEGRLSLRRSDAADLYERMLERVRALPAVERATVAEASPYMSGSAIAPFTSERDQQALWGDGREVPYSTVVGSGFFATVGATSLRGRDFDTGDQRGGSPVAIINAPLAKALWAGQDALGKCMYLTAKRTCVRVVGVLGGVWKFSVLQREKMAVYLPMTQEESPHPTMIFARVYGDPAAATRDIRRAMQSVRVDLPAARIRGMRDFADPEFRPWRLGAAMFTAFGVMALIVGAIGIYSVVTVTVSQRAHELGIRAALGARRVDILRVVAGSELLAVCVGLAAGTTIALAAARWSRPLLYHTSPRDPMVIAATAGLLLVAAVLATAIPLLRALRLDPAVILRTE